MFRPPKGDQNKLMDYGAIDVKMNGSVLEEKSSFKIRWLSFSSKLDWGSYIFSFKKLSSRKLDT